ncbi:PEP-CTERM sorting domain-containing protein, partial [Oculatella sp. LEGE 06141]|nr:PEP-CTERM sorting domain-containing protein [Oculatella sp. LEGE 06141]
PTPTPEAVPEPATVLGLALIGGVFALRRRA